MVCSMRINKAYPNWATDDSIPFEAQIQRWAFLTVIRQRGITWQEMCEALGGVSRNRLFQLLHKMGLSVAIDERLDKAIKAIVQNRHAAVCSCSDGACAVYSSIEGIDSRLRDAKKGAFEEWRELTRTKLTTEHTRAA